MSLRFLCKLFFVIVFLFARLSEAQCFSEDPLDESAITPIACGIVTESRHRVNDKRKHVDMFQFHLTCNSTPPRCAQIGRALEKAGDIIAGTLSLNTPILVNVTFLNFCKELNVCSTNDEVILGRATPAQYIPMKDDDGEIRYYPQALVKQQLSHTTHRMYVEFDITAKFNDVPNFWVEGGEPIREDQNDFTLVALHELVHGLGLSTSWRNNIFDQGLTTNVTFESLDDGSPIWHFKEYAFDRYIIVIPEKTRMTSYKNELNAFSENAGAQYTSLKDWKDAFIASPQEEISEKLYQYAQTPNSLGFQTNGTTGIVILETSLNPFMPGSSITHIDYKTYMGASDFLMMFRTNAGVTLNEAIIRGGNYSGGAIGPLLKAILETLGYATPKNPNPYEPQPDTSITFSQDDASTGALSESKFNTGLLLAMIIVVLLVVHY